MRDGQESLDVVVRSEGGLSLTVASTQMTQDQLVLVGTLNDPETPTPVATTIEVVLARELAEGAHVERVTEFSVTLGEEETFFNWEVETRELAGGYRLQDARVATNVGEMRAFAIEDLAATVGVGLAATAVAAWAWRTHAREERARADADRKWDECLALGGSPTWVYEVGDEAGLEGGLEGTGLKLKSRVKVGVRCDMSAASDR